MRGVFVACFPSLCASAFDLCKRRILAAELPGIPDHFTDEERALYMTSLVPFQNVNMVGISVSIVQLNLISSLIVEGCCRDHKNRPFHKLLPIFIQKFRIKTSFKLNSEPNLDN